MEYSMLEGDQVYVVERARATRALEALAVAQIPSVQVFRKKHLNGELLDREQALAFLNRGAREPLIGRGRPLTMLAYVDPDDPELTEQDIHVHARSPLAALRQPGRDVQMRYDWSPGMATWCILTGQVPHRPPIWISERAGGRVALLVEPWVPADQVTAAYRDAQRALVGEFPRPIGQVKLELATFLAGRLANGHVPWRELMNEWNAAHPSSQYKRPETLQRDWLRVRRALQVRPGHTD